MPLRPSKDALGRPDLDNYEAAHTESTSSVSKLFDAAWLIRKLFGTAFHEAARFMVSTPYFTDEAWEAVRPLGKGGFGTVGLWRLTDETGTTVDEVAIKEVDRIPAYARALECPNREGLLLEAAVQTEVNDKEKGDPYYNSYLRRFKYFRNDEKCRFYTVFSGCNDLDRLRLLYRVRDQYFPDLFLWHVFHSLAKAIEVLSKPPPDNSFAIKPNSGADTTKWFVFHGDMKPGNVFLDYPPDHPDGDDPTSHYPAIRLADFGYSKYTGPDDRRNPRRYRQLGTRIYLAPEQIQFGQKWRPPLMPLNTQIGDATNVWAVGRTMFEMLTLAHPWDFEKLWDEDERPADYPGRDHLFPLRKLRNLAPQSSSTLVRLVWMCLYADPAQRPSVADLVRRTQAGLDALKKHAISARPGDQKDQPLPQELVHVDNSAINAMSVGNARYLGDTEVEIDLTDELDLFKNVAKFDDPDGEPLQLPAGTKWDGLRDQYRPLAPPNLHVGRDLQVHFHPPAPTPVPTPAPVPPVTPPTRADYWRMTVGQMQDELVYRGPYAWREVRRLRKNQLWWRLKQADLAGKFGRGAHRG